MRYACAQEPASRQCAGRRPHKCCGQQSGTAEAHKPPVPCTSAAPRSQVQPGSSYRVTIRKPLGLVLSERKPTGAVADRCGVPPVTGR